MSEQAHDFVFEPWPVGTRFLIRNQTAGGRPMIEGVATIRRAINPDDNLYEVEFEREPGVTYERRVEGGDILTPCKVCGEATQQRNGKAVSHGPGMNGAVMCAGVGY